MPLKIRPSAFKASTHIFGRHLVAPLLYPVGHTLDGKPRTPRSEEDDLNGIPKFLHAAHALQIGHSAQGRSQRKVKFWPTSADPVQKEENAQPIVQQVEDATGKAQLR